MNSATSRVNPSTFGNSVRLGLDVAAAWGEAWPPRTLDAATAARISFLRLRFIGDSDSVMGRRLSPSHPNPTANDVEDGFGLAVVMRSGLCVGLDQHRDGPQFARSRSCACDSSGAGHARSLGCVWVQVAGWNDARHAAVFLAPVRDGEDFARFRCGGLTSSPGQL